MLSIKSESKIPNSNTYLTWKGSTHFPFASRNTEIIKMNDWISKRVNSVLQKWLSNNEWITMSEWEMMNELLNN